MADTIDDTYFDLGEHTLSVTTSEPDAQMWFDRGLNWIYSFHREEAVRCFERVVEIDPECAMGYWGLAHATGPYYNGVWKRMPVAIRPHMLAAAHGYVRAAEAKAHGANEMEQALIAALIERFPDAVNDDEDVFDSWDDAYAVAMRSVYERWPDHEDVAALTVDALISRTPWQLWDLDARTPAEGADTAEALAIMERAFEATERNGTPPHPGLLHFYIHTMEMSPTPEAALTASDTLRGLVPDAAHLIHMGSHIYILCGEYEKALESNVDAVVADEHYVARHPELGVYTIYMLHNIHFQIYAAMFLGRYEHAIRAADHIWDIVTPESLRIENEFLVNYYEGFYGMKVHALIRFGRWDDIIAEPLPTEPELFCVTTALWHYAKGVAYAATGRIEEAEEQQRLFMDAWERVPPERIVFNNESREILRVGQAMLSGELEYRRGNFDHAFEELRRCVELYDNLNYSEPWVWMQPPRHALGALLLEQGRVAEAADVYRADLGLDDTLVRPSQHPGNIWALHGYLECCRELGRTDEVAELEAQLAAVQTLSDTDVTSSCFCRNESPCCD